MVYKLEEKFLSFLSQFKDKGMKRNLVKTLTWKLVFKILTENKEKSLELARYKLSDVHSIKYFLSQFFEEQKDWINNEKNLGKGLGYEIILIDDKGKDLKLKNLYEVLHAKGEILSVFSMTTDAIGEILAEGAS